jgi:hypothetical protein
MVEKNKIFHNILEQPFILCFLLFGVTAFASIPAERLRRPYYQG